MLPRPCQQPPAHCNLKLDFDISRGPTEVHAERDQPVYTNETLRLITRVSAENGNAEDNRKKSGSNTWTTFDVNINGTGWVEVGRKETRDTTLTAGNYQNEEVAYTIPDSPGSRICFRSTIDAADEIRETNEGDNRSHDECFTIQNPPNPPNFRVLALGLTEGLTVKKDARVHPWCTVINTGGPSPAGIRIAYYINADKYRTDDGIDAAQLCAGCQQTESVKNDDIRLGDKGTRTFRCCADYQGAVVESDEGNNCATIVFTVK